MPFIMLGHVSADAQSAQVFGQRLRGLETASGVAAVALDGAAPLVNFGSDVMLALLWSEQAAASEETYVSLLDRLQNPAFLIRLDETSLGAALAQHRLLMVSADTDNDGLMQAIKYAPLGQQRAARRIVRVRSAETQGLTPRRSVAMRAPIPEPEIRHADKRDYARLFAGGAARGFAGSMATLGMGAMVAFGVSGHVGALGTAPADARNVDSAFDNAAVEQVGATASSDLDVFAPFAPDNPTTIVDHETLQAQAATLRQVATAQRLAIERHLQDASVDVEGARGRTLDVVDQLDAIASESPIVMSPAPEIPSPKLLSEPSPPQELYVDIDAPDLFEVRDVKFVIVPPLFDQEVFGVVAEPDWRDPV